MEKKGDTATLQAADTITRPPSDHHYGCKNSLLAVVFFFYLGVYCIFASLAGRAGDFALVVLPYVVSLAGLSPQDRPRSPFPSFFSPTGISVPNKYIPTVWLEHAVVQLHAWSFKPSFVWFSSLPMQVHRMQEMSFGQAPQIRRWSAYWRVQAPSLLPHAAAPNTKYYFNLFFIIFFN